MEMILMKESEVCGIEAQIIDAGCRQYRHTFTIPESCCAGIKVLKLSGFSVDDLAIEGPVVKSLIKREALIRENGGFKIAVNWRR